MRKPARNCSRAGINRQVKRSGVNRFQPFGSLATDLTYSVEFIIPSGGGICKREIRLLA